MNYATTPGVFIAKIKPTEEYSCDYCNKLLKNHYVSKFALKLGLLDQTCPNAVFDENKDEYIHMSKIMELAK